MRRGVFAITWFFLLASTLVNLYAIYGTLVSSELKNQGVLMDADEAFYMARNFEYDFRRAVVDGEVENFKERWNFTYGNWQDGRCVQVNVSLDEFLNMTILQRGNTLIFSPLMTGRSCLAAEVRHQYFKTYGVVVSTVCINRSSPLFLC